MKTTRHVLATGLEFPEGPTHLGAERVAFVEIRGGRVSLYDHGSVRTIAATGGGPNGATRGPDGTLYVTNNGGLCLGPHGRWIADVTINAGGVLQGDNTNKTLTMNNGTGTDFTNNGTIDFGPGKLATIFSRQSTQWTGPGTWTLSEIDLNGNTLTFAAGSISASSSAFPRCWWSPILWKQSTRPRLAAPLYRSSRRRNGRPALASG